MGTAYPLNSVGELPVEYLSGTPEYKARSLFSNAQQILRCIEVAGEHRARTSVCQARIAMCNQTRLQLNSCKALSVAHGIENSPLVRWPVLLLMRFSVMSSISFQLFYRPFPPFARSGDRVFLEAIEELLKCMHCSSTLLLSLWMDRLRCPLLSPMIIHAPWQLDSSMRQPTSATSSLHCRSKLTATSRPMVWEWLEGICQSAW